MYFIIRLLRLILLGILFYILYRLLRKGEGFSFSRFFRKFRRKSDQPHPQAPLEVMKKDPVCGTYLPENQALKYTHGGETYYFCSEECRQAFRQLEKK